MTIKELRENNKLSQARLAAALGVSPSLIGAIETGKKNISEKLAAKVSEVYGVTLNASTGEAVAAQAEAAVKEAAAVAVSLEKKAEAAVKKTVKKTQKAVEKVEKKTSEKKPSAKKSAAKKEALSVSVLIQSPLGGEITPAAVLAKVPADADKVYVRVDQNKAYWVRGEETGSVDLW